MVEYASGDRYDKSSSKQMTEACADNLFRIPGPTGSEIAIPATVEECADPYSQLKSDDAIREYYAENGYVVLRGVIPKTLCQEVMSCFAQEVKTYDGFIYRQATANPEKHVLTEHGYMLNSILNVQDLPAGQHGRFRQQSLAVLTHDNVRSALCTLFGEAGKLVQSMYFEGNPATWAHQDTYYLDSESIGELTAGWFALEDISPGAGRFFVYPHSQKIDVGMNGGDFDIAFNHDKYKQLIIDLIGKFDLECRAPALRQGDVLFWSSKTIHGSLTTTEPQHSRSSLTAHYIAKSHRFLQLQSRIKPLNLSSHNAMEIHHPKDQNFLKNRLMLSVESHFPRSFQLVKKLAVKVLTR